MARADRLIDAVRDRGAEGYQQTIRDFALPDRAFRLGLWLQRRFGIERVLTERLADRFEILMVRRTCWPSWRRSTCNRSPTCWAAMPRHGWAR